MLFGGTFKAGNLTFRIINQCRSYNGLNDRGEIVAVDWHSRCNRGAMASIVSAYTNDSAEDLCFELNKYYDAAYFGAISSNNYWNRYGLTITKTMAGTNTNYESALKTQLQGGGYALFWLNIGGNGGTYVGKSGAVWTRVYHWVAALSYRKSKNGKDEIFIADPGNGNSGWHGLDEFTTHGITNAVFINEK